jgi:hypothetical protein
VAARGEQAGPHDGVHHLVRKPAVDERQRAQLQVGTPREVDLPVAVVVRHLREDLKGSGWEVAAGQTQANQCAVVGGPGVEHAGAPVAAQSNGWEGHRWSSEVREPVRGVLE